jgi:hypothetical protein
LGIFKKIKLVDAAIVAASILAAAGFWTRNIVLIALIIPAGIVLVTSKMTNTYTLAPWSGLILSCYRTIS